MTRVIVFLPISTVVNDQDPNLASTHERTMQYVNGLETFFTMFRDIQEGYSDIQWDVMLMDNTVSYLNISISNVVPSYVRVKCRKMNSNGRRNKGAGVVDQWRENLPIFTNYDYIVHFEPRKLLKSPYFLHEFSKNPRTLVSFANDPVKKKGFFTGYFAVSSKEMEAFCQKYPSSFLVEHNLCLEYVFGDFLAPISPDHVLEKLDMIWFNASLNKQIHY